MKLHDVMVHHYAFGPAVIQLSGFGPGSGAVLVAAPERAS